ncbi:Iron-sulfur cluster assembly scaffold protein IscU [hydrothermal vent metagenome]|uniref:Iron-sulfur cluster assembly scaffold protein IscU n=1 Tax=hydrothermal vent metagenome TaxID=652676 RepID=A0A1W1BPL8_9ZZZZ
MFENVEVPEGMNKEVLEHLMYPHNYGKLDDANGIGVAIDEKTGEYVILYLKLNDKQIVDVRFATNGCQDTVVVGSMFTDMIKEQDASYAQKAVEKIYQKLGDTMSDKQRVCADMVFTSLVAALKNYENLQNGKTEEAHILKMKESCETEESNE